MGLSHVSRSAPPRSPLRALRGGRATPDRRHTSANPERPHEESRMTSTLTLGLRARNAAPAKPRYQICLIHPFDPRGQKVGGLETYIRDFITFHPTDTDILFVGVDSIGDLKLGEVRRLTF